MLGRTMKVGNVAGVIAGCQASEVRHPVGHESSATVLPNDAAPASAQA